jgi:predicted acyltransferase
MKDAPEVSAANSAISSPATTGRLISLDAFRGATIAAMMLANNAGDWSNVYGPLKHADWHGWTFTDTIFPFFIWIVGVAIPFSLVRRMEQGEKQSVLLARIIRRSLLLIALGIFLGTVGYLYKMAFAPEGVAHWFKDWMENVRFPGVLQRIGVCYLFTSIIVLRTGIRGQIIATAFFLVSCWLLMSFGSMPGFPAGDLSKEGNFAHWVDKSLFEPHLYRKTWDPEGLVSTLPAVATCLFGVLTGHLLRSARSAETRAVWIFVWGNILMFAGQLLNLSMPINKPIWTSSYSLFMAGLAMNVFGVFYWFMDIKGWQKWAKPLSIYGMNAITVFVLAGILGRLSIEKKIMVDGKEVPLKSFLYGKFFTPMAEPGGIFYGLGAETAAKNASLLWALIYMVGLYLVAYVFYRKKWFIRL